MRVSHRPRPVHSALPAEEFDRRVLPADDPEEAGDTGRGAAQVEAAGMSFFERGLNLKRLGSL